MTSGSKLLLTGVCCAAVALAIAWAVDVDVTGDVELPEVTADIRGGEMPRVDVNTVDIDVSEGTATVPYPSDIEVETSEAEVPFPKIEVTPPEEDTYAEENDLNDTNTASGNQ